MVRELLYLNIKLPVVWFLILLSSHQRPPFLWPVPRGECIKIYLHEILSYLSYHISVPLLRIIDISNLSLSTLSFSLSLKLVSFSLSLSYFCRLWFHLQLPIHLSNILYNSHPDL